MKKLRQLLAGIAMLAGVMSAGAALPNIQVKTLDGVTVDASTISNGDKPMVVCFFATWCKPCNRELKAIHEEYADWVEETGMKVVAISIDDAQNASKVKPLVDAEGWEYEVYLDSNSELMRTLGIQMIPHLLIFDGNGNMVESHSGYTEGSEAHIIERVRELVD